MRRARGAPQSSWGSEPKDRGARSQSAPMSSAVPPVLTMRGWRGPRRRCPEVFMADAVSVESLFRDSADLFVLIAMDRRIRLANPALRGSLRGTKAGVDFLE